MEIPARGPGEKVCVASVSAAGRVVVEALSAPGSEGEHGAVTDQATQERVPCQARTDRRWEAEALPGAPTPATAPTSGLAWSAAVCSDHSPFWLHYPPPFCAPEPPGPFLRVLAHPGTPPPSVWRSLALSGNSPHPGVRTARASVAIVCHLPSHTGCALGRGPAAGGEASLTQS